MYPSNWPPERQGAERELLRFIYICLARFVGGFVAPSRIAGRGIRPSLFTLGRSREQGAFFRSDLAYDHFALRRWARTNLSAVENDRLQELQKVLFSAIVFADVESCMEALGRFAKFDALQVLGGLDEFPGEATRPESVFGELAPTLATEEAQRDQARETLLDLVQVCFLRSLGARGENSQLDLRRYHPSLLLCSPIHQFHREFAEVVRRDLDMVQQQVRRQGAREELSQAQAVADSTVSSILYSGEIDFGGALQAFGVLDDVIRAGNFGRPPNIKPARSDERVDPSGRLAQLYNLLAPEAGTVSPAGPRSPRLPEPSWDPSPGIRYTTAFDSPVLGGSGLDGAAGGAFDEVAPAGAEPDERFLEASPIDEPATGKRRPFFYFYLDSPDARGNYVVAGVPIALSFRFDEDVVPGGIVMDGDKLDSLPKDDFDLGIIVFRGRNSEVHSASSEVARIRDGRLAGNIEFIVEFDDAPEADASLWIEFNYRGDRLYQFELEFQVVTARSDLPLTPQTLILDLDVGRVLAARQAVASGSSPPAASVTYRVSRDVLYFSMEVFHPEGIQRFPERGLDQLTAPALAQQLELRTNPLANLYAAGSWDNTPDDSGNYPAYVQGNLAEAMKTLAHVGNSLYSLLVDEPALQDIIEAINALPDGSRITFRTGSFPFPWELLYPKAFSLNMQPEVQLAYPVDAQAFWGARFAIETLMPLAEADQMKLSARNREARNSIVVSVNPTIGRVDPAREHPRDRHYRLAVNLNLRGVICCFYDKGGDIATMLGRNDVDASMVYFYCHGSTPTTWTGAGLEVLQFDNATNCDRVTVYSQTKFPSAPLVVLNSCRSGAISPLAFRTLNSEFMKKGALGLIATSFEIPVAFGAQFGEQLIELFCHGTGNLSVGMLELRRRHLLAGNPAALFYSTLCQLEL